MSTDADVRQILTRVSALNYTAHHTLKDLEKRLKGKLVTINKLAVMNSSHRHLLDVTDLRFNHFVDSGTHCSLTYFDAQTLKSAECWYVPMDIIIFEEE